MKTPQEKIEVKHTPGPWKIVQNGDQTDIHHKCFKEGREITVLADVRTKDAPLVSAAPDLLEACYLAAARLESGSTKQIEFNASVAGRVRAAIAKAKGQSC